ncbi:MAG: TRAP transporter large permease subunit [Bacillota bacterium]
MVERVKSKKSRTFMDYVMLIDKNFEIPFLIAGLLAIILLITFQTINRYVLTWKDIGNVTVWSEELSRFIFIWISYLAFSVSIKTRQNIRVDILYNMIPPRIQKASWVVVDILFIILTITISTKGWDLVAMQMTKPQTTPALQIPYFLPYFILPFGFALMSFRIVQDLIKTVRSIPILDTVLAVTACAVMAAPILVGINMPALVWLFGYLSVFLVVGLPVAASLGLSGLITIAGTKTLPIDYVAQIAYTSIDSFPIMAIPFFVAAGVFMGMGGLSKRLLSLADEILGSLTGGMALVTVFTCMFFAAISGSGPATVAAVGSLTIPAMIERGYNKAFAAAVVASAGSIGVMIPPSNPFVVYGISAQQSIGKLFMAGIVPGILVGLCLMAISYYYSWKNGWKGTDKKRTLLGIIKAFWDAKWALMVPVIILGGIYGGFMTPTESAAVSAFYGLLVGIFVYKELNLKNLPGAFIESAKTSATVIVLMAMATIFGYIMTLEQVPVKIAKVIFALTENKWVILIIINIFLLWVGTFMDTLAAIVILTPILLPVATKVGVDPLHFGVIMVVNLAIGFLTPPVGINLFVASGISKLGIEPIAKAVLPFILGMIVILGIIVAIPHISLYLTQMVK